MDRIPFFVAEAVRHSINGRPGAVYLDISGTLVNGSAAEESIVFPPPCPAPPKTLAECVSHIAPGKGGGGRGREHHNCAGVVE